MLIEKKIPVEEESFSPSELYPVRFLLIDDDRTYGILLSAVAQTLGWNVDQVSERQIGRNPELIRNYDILLVDYDLENIAGTHLLEWLKVAVKNVPSTILISEYAALNHARFVQPVTFLPKRIGAKLLLTRSAEIVFAEQNKPLGIPF